MRALSNVPGPGPAGGRVRWIGACRGLAFAAVAMAGLGATPASADAPDDGDSPATTSLGDGTRRQPVDIGWTLDLTARDVLDATTLDARGDGPPGPPGSGRLVAHEVLAGLLAWEAGRGLGDGAHVRPVIATVRSDAFATADVEGVPALGAAVRTGSASIERLERYRHDALDLSLEGSPVLPANVVVDDVPGLSFERRTLYQAATGRLFVDFRLRHRDPAHGMAALDDEARTAAAIARMRSLSTLVLEPAPAGSPGAFRPNAF